METLYVHNVVRGRHNRTLRKLQPQRHSLKQYVGAGQFRLLRGSPLPLSEEQILKHLDELIDKEKRGVIEVKDGNGHRVDLSGALEYKDRKEAAEATRPIKRPDSIANDKQYSGAPSIPQYPGGAPEVPVMGDENAVPDLVSAADEPAAEPVVEQAQTETTEEDVQDLLDESHTDPDNSPDTKPQGGKKKRKS